jgi:hypothetical protein
MSAQKSITQKNNEPGGKMVWYPREMKRTNVAGVYPSSAGGGLGQDYRSILFVYYTELLCVIGFWSACILAGKFSISVS